MASLLTTFYGDKIRGRAVTKSSCETESDVRSAESEHRSSAFRVTKASGIIGGISRGSDATALRMVKCAADDM